MAPLPLNLAQLPLLSLEVLEQTDPCCCSRLAFDYCIPSALTRLANSLPRLPINPLSANSNLSNQPDTDIDHQTGQDKALKPE